MRSMAAVGNKLMSTPALMAGLGATPRPFNSTSVRSAPEAAQIHIGGAGGLARAELIRVAKHTL